MHSLHFPRFSLTHVNVQSPTILSAGFGKQTPKSSADDINSKQRKNKNALITPEINPTSASMNIHSNIKDKETAYLNHCPSFNASFPGVRQIHGDQPVYEIDDFFSEDMCNDYIERSQKIGYQMTSQTFIGNTLSTRTSTTWYLAFNNTPELISRANKLTNLPIFNMEEPQIVRYEFGQQFTWHYDYIPKPSQDSSGNRLCTLLVYLNDVNNGGATCFKDLNIQVKPKIGKALLFFPCYKDGKLDDRTLHAGQVTMETKWIAQM